MLTSDLAQSWQRGGRIRPRHVNPQDPKYLREAEDLVRLFERRTGDARSELERDLQDYVGTGTDYKTLRGLIKLLTDRCEFETPEGPEPSEMRRALFTRARQFHPVVSAEARRAAVAEAAQDVGCEPGALLDNLYGDLPENQKLVSFESLTGGELLDLYNVAQAQALLYRCVEMRLQVEPQSAEGYRELFGSIKAYGLISTIRGNAHDGYEVRLDGPVSMFHRSQKYGVQMAVFLPALLTCKGWRMRAEIHSKPEGVAYFELDSRQTELRSHYLSVPHYENPAARKFVESWGRSGQAAVLEPSREVLDAGGSAFVPDYVIRHPSGRNVYLEVLGFWTPQHLRARLEELAHAGLTNFVLAAWEELRGSRDPLMSVPARTIVFKRSLDPGVVALMVEELAVGGPGAERAF